MRFMKRGKMGRRTWIGAALVIAIVALVVAAVTVDTASKEPSATSTQPSQASSLPPLEPLWPTAAFIGDSFTVGAKAGSPEANYANVVCKIKKWVCILNGEGSTGFVNPGGHKDGKDIYSKRIPKVLQGVLPSVVVVQGGINDPGTETVQPAVQDMIVKLKKELPDAKIVIVGPIQPPRRSPQVIELNRQAMKAAAAAENVQFVDPIGERWLTDPSLISDDGIHPNTDGYRIFAERLAADI